MDMGFVGHQIVEEIRAAHPDRNVRLNTSGTLDGKWDKSRIGQALSNLLGNAIQYGFKDAPVDVSIDGNKDTVTLSVHNYGLPIPEGKISTIFNPLTRATHEGQGGPASTNLGLGLFITNEVLLAHGGTLEVSSSEKEGTTFTAKFPRVQPRRGLRLA
jgi:signal transduction histidine kinase